MSPASGSPVIFVSTIEDAVRDAGLVIDCVPDELESKLEILWLLDRMAPPHAVFATPTLNLSIADLAGCTYRAGQCIAIAASPTSLGGLDAKAGSAIVLRAAPATTQATISLVADFGVRWALRPRSSQHSRNKTRTCRAFLTGGAIGGKPRRGGASEGREALSTAGQETGGTNCTDLRQMRTCRAPVYTLAGVSSPINPLPSGGNI